MSLAPHIVHVQAQGLGASTVAGTFCTICISSGAFSTRTPSAEQHDHISFNYINNTATLKPLGGLLITFNFFAVSSATFPWLGWLVQKCAYTGEHPRGHEKPSTHAMFCAGSTFLNAGLPHSHCEFRGILVLSPQIYAPTEVPMKQLKILYLRVDMKDHSL